MEIGKFDFAVSLRGEGSGWGAETLPMVCLKKTSPPPKVWMLSIGRKSSQPLETTPNFGDFGRLCQNSICLVEI